MVSLEPLRRTRVLLRRGRRTRRIANRLEQLVAGAVLLRHRPHVVYLNTVKSACYVRPALLLRRPVVLHVHELGLLASHTLRRYRLGKLYHRVRLVACSAEVATSLSGVSGVAVHAITVIPSMVDGPRIESLARQRLGGALLPEGSHPVLVGACGLGNVGKGVDQWLTMARLVRDRATDLDLDVRFVWIGRPDVEHLHDRLRDLELEAVVQFTGELENPYPVMAQVDVFTHPARQDSFPLVVLEAMALARPVVAFDVGGIPTQVGDAGIVVPAGDVEAMAEAVIRLGTDAAARRDLGAKATARVKAHFSIERMHDATRHVLESLLSAPPGSGSPRDHDIAPDLLDRGDHFVD